MKIIRLIVICCTILCCSYNQTKAQPYESVFGKDTTQWNIVYRIPDYFPTLIFKAYGDTLINKQKYVPVYMGYHDTPLELYGYFKEDVDSGRLWFRNLEEQEKLLMDLSLEKGDSLYFGRNIEYSYTVDSVYYDSGKKRVSFESIYSESVLFIEGLGPFNMFYDKRVDFPEYAQIRCKKKDNILVFMNENYSTCVDTVTSAEHFEDKTFRIYPNPVNDVIRIATNSNECGKIEMFNSAGDRVLYDNIANNGQLSIGHLSKGVYLIKYQLQNNQFTTKLTKK